MDEVLVIFGIVKVEASVIRRPRLITLAASSLYKGVLRMCTVRGIICRYNWIPDYTLIMLVNNIT